MDGRPPPPEGGPGGGWEPDWTAPGEGMEPARGRGVPGGRLGRWAGGGQRCWLTAGPAPPAAGRTGWRWETAWNDSGEGDAPAARQRVSRRQPATMAGGRQRCWLNGWPGPAGSMALAEPAAGVDRLAVAAQLEVHAGVDAGGRRGGAHGLAGGDRIAHVVQQRLVVAVHAHPAVAVVEDQQHAVAAQEAGVDHPAVRHRAHLAAAAGADQHAVAVAVHV